MTNIKRILRLYPESFRANLYTTEPFRMIGLIDVDIEYDYGVERVTLAYYRSSGTNSGKTKGLWYPIVGIKTRQGSFVEFTKYLNYVLTRCTRGGKARAGWLAKSLFFSRRNSEGLNFRGFSNGIHHESLLVIGKTLRNMFENGEFEEVDWLYGEELNNIVTSKKIYYGNMRTQRENFEKFIEDIFNER
ncbi:hypothetical protein [Clostridium sp. B9]|uniref:hypothetical protein n=1 Tax=Clostridium sp. B9 TaxID=3423224 RepID=UPI003D2EBDEB